MADKKIRSLDDIENEYQNEDLEDQDEEIEENDEEKRLREIKRNR